jgi:hypothetical protein
MLWKMLRKRSSPPLSSRRPFEGPGPLRTSYSAAHTDEELDAVLAAFNKCGRMIGLI